MQVIQILVARQWLQPIKRALPPNSCLTASQANKDCLFCQNSNFECFFTFMRNLLFMAIVEQPGKEVLFLLSHEIFYVQPEKITRCAMPDSSMMLQYKKGYFFFPLPLRIAFLPRLVTKLKFQYKIKKKKEEEEPERCWVHFSTIKATGSLSYRQSNTPISSAPTPPFS